MFTLLTGFRHVLVLGVYDETFRHSKYIFVGDQPKQELLRAYDNVISSGFHKAAGTRTPADEAAILTSSERDAVTSSSGHEIGMRSAVVTWACSNA
jgi:hypothetical protein